MTVRRILALALLLAIVLPAQRGFRRNRSSLGGGNRRWGMYEYEMQNPAEDPPDAWEKTEFAFARLRFVDIYGGHVRWGTDANKSERQFIQGVRRLTRINARSVEQIVDIDSDDLYDWPWLYAVGIGQWNLSQQHVIRLRNFFDRGGFLMVDDFHNEGEWDAFMSGIKRIFRKPVVEEIPDGHASFRLVYDLRERMHIPGLNVVGTSFPWERQGVGHHFRGVFDEKGRMQVAACFNMDLGDAWEWADIPEYPEKIASHAYRVGVNYVAYYFTH